MKIRRSVALAQVPAPGREASLAGQAYHLLEEMIVTLVLAPGAMLSEAIDHIRRIRCIDTSSEALADYFQPL